MEKQANTMDTLKGLGKATSKLGVSSKNLARAIKNKDKSRAMKAGAHIAKGAMLPGAGLAAAGAGVALSGEKGKKRREATKRVVTDSLLPSFKASMGQKALSAVGGAAGTAVQMKRGKSFGDAAKTGGLAGMAIGDTLGSIAVPQGRFIKMHKKEFGTMPSAKDMGKLFAANTVPTAASWGAIMSLKKPRKFYQNNAKTVMEGMASKGKSAKNALRYAASPDAQKVNNKQFMDKFVSIAKGPKQDNSNLGKTMAKAMLVDKAVDEVVDLPTKFVTPESLIRKKKEAEMNKTAFNIVDEAFEKMAEEFTKEEKERVKSLTKDLRKSTVGRDMTFKQRLKSDLGGSAKIGGLGAAGALAGVGANKLAKGKIPHAALIGYAVGTGAGAMSHNKKVVNQAQRALDNAVQRNSNDPEGLKAMGRGKVGRFFKGDYNSSTYKGIAKDIVRQERTACELVSDILYK